MHTLLHYSKTDHSMEQHHTDIPALQS